jgi:hypothetical protein
MPSFDKAAACSSDLTAAMMFSFLTSLLEGAKKCVTMEPPL